MNYLILHHDEAFYTNWFDVDNNYIVGMVVFNLQTNMFTINGLNWIPIGEDSL